MSLIGLRTILDIFENHLLDKKNCMMESILSANQITFVYVAKCYSQPLHAR